jgi:signal transduction histidine kinase
LLRHILANLLSNAVKYSAQGMKVGLSVHREGPQAVFEVRDRGIGIAPDDRQRLFEAFQRGQNVGEIPGTGLGLVIVKRCIELHGGEIEVASELGSGTTVTVRLNLFERAMRVRASGRSGRITANAKRRTKQAS